jgi:WD40-like Beta Propeller Repeat
VVSVGPDLYVCSDRGSGYVWNIWQLSVDATTLKVERMERLTTGVGNDSNPAPAAGGKLAFATHADSTRLWTFPFDAAAGQLTGQGHPVTDPTAMVGQAALAPNGHMLAYSLFGVGTRQWELWTADLSGGKQLLARDNFVRQDPSWSPDGTRLAYVRAPWPADEAGERALRALRSAPQPAAMNICSRDR